MLNKKEKRAASERFRPTNNPPVIVVPEREAPGISAKDCAMPMMSVSLIVKSLISLLCSATRSEIAK